MQYHFASSAARDIKLKWPGKSGEALAYVFFILKLLCLIPFYGGVFVCSPVILGLLKGILCGSRNEAGTCLLWLAISAIYLISVLMAFVKVLKRKNDIHLESLFLRCGILYAISASF